MCQSVHRSGLFEARSTRKRTKPGRGRYHRKIGRRAVGSCPGTGAILRTGGGLGTLFSCCGSNASKQGEGMSCPGPGAGAVASSHSQIHGPAKLGEPGSVVPAQGRTAAWGRRPVITWALTGLSLTSAGMGDTDLISHACALSSGAEPKAILPKKEKLKLRRERWLQSKFTSLSCELAASPSSFRCLCHVDGLLPMEAGHVPVLSDPGGSRRCATLGSVGSSISG